MSLRDWEMTHMLPIGLLPVFRLEDCSGMMRSQSQPMHAASVVVLVERYVFDTARAGE